jgi:hypothetical protein
MPTTKLVGVTVTLPQRGCQREQLAHLLQQHRSMGQQLPSGPQKRREFTAEVSSLDCLGPGPPGWVGLGSAAAAASSCLSKLDACNSRAFFTEKRAKQTRYGPANRLEFTAGVSFNFAQVRLVRRVSAGTATSSPRLPRYEGLPAKKNSRHAR